MVYSLSEYNWVFRICKHSKEWRIIGIKIGQKAGVGEICGSENNYCFAEVD